MKLLTPLGLLGLLAIVVLIIIYIIRPNYQQKFISSTFVWKLSLKYRKKKIPTSKLRNFLIILCQILILTSCALILAQPNQVLKAEVKETEVVLVVDSSASMRTQSNGETRFERAVDSAIKFADSVFNQNGIVSVVLAEEKASFLVQRARVENRLLVNDALEPLLDEDTACAYGSSDIEGAIDLCEDIISENPDTLIYLYTDVEYAYVPEGITVVDVCDESEWNAAILNAEAKLDEGYYSFTVDVACYGKDAQVAVELEIHGANAYNSEDAGLTVSFTEYVECVRDETVRIVFINSDLHQQSAEASDSNVVYYLISDTDEIFAYQSVHVFINEDDSFPQDNSFNIYSGQKELLKVQYCSRVEGKDSEFASGANPFFASILYTLEVAYEDRWDIEIHEVKSDQEPEMEGFDLYIFEHLMPDKLPTDGVVLLVNPRSAPSNSGIRVGSHINLGGRQVPMMEAEPHSILNHITPEDITLGGYVPVTYYDPAYQVLLTCENKPTLLVRDDEKAKIAVMAFSVHYSNVTISKDFPILMYNLFEHFFPATVKGNAFEVNENVAINARGDELLVTMGDTLVATLTEFPTTLRVSTPGTYELTQTTFSGKNVTESIYVKIPAIESNIWYVAESIDNPYAERNEEDFYKDLMVYIAAALVALLFIEWWLQSRETM